MGYDLLIFRNVFVNIKDVESSTTLIGNDKNPIIKEHVDSLRGWDVSEIVQQYITNDTQELGADEIIELYQSVCESKDEEADKSLIEILQTDYDQHTHYEDGGVFYELHQSY
jgi:hypothetical protein